MLYHKTKLGKLYKGDCLDINKIIKTGSVDLIVTDLPYGNMKGIDLEYKGYGRKNGNGHMWDNIIDINSIYKIVNRILRKNGKMLLFGQDPFSLELKNKALPNIPYCYNMIWEKNDFANALLCNKAPVSYYEDILVFKKNYDLEYVTPNNPMYLYFKKCKENSGMSTTEFNYLYCDYKGKTKNRHRGMVARCWENSQFWFPNKDIYENVLQPTGFFPLPYEEIKNINDEFNNKYTSIFNLWEGNKYKSNILKYKKDYNGNHPTEKPVLLIEDLIKTFSNEGDLIVDLTSGSGTTSIACENTNRRWVCIEKDEDDKGNNLGYCDITVERLNELNKDN